MSFHSVGLSTNAPPAAAPFVAPPWPWLHRGSGEVRVSAPRGALSDLLAGRAPLDALLPPGRVGGGCLWEGDKGQLYTYVYIYICIHMCVCIDVNMIDRDHINSVIQYYT